MEGLYIKDVELPTVFTGDLVLRIKPNGSVIATNEGMVGGTYSTAVPFDEEKIVGDYCAKRSLVRLPLETYEKLIMRRE